MSTSLTRRRLRYHHMPRALVVAGVVVVGALTIWAATSLFTSSSGSPPNPSVSRPAQVVTPTPDVKLDPAARRVAARFIETAVARRHLAESYYLTAPSYRSGFSLARWKSGDIPVVPFPAAAAKFKIDYSHPDEAMLDVMLIPVPGSSVATDYFTIQLHRFKTGAQHRWLVTYWAPTGRSAMPNKPN